MNEPWLGFSFMARPHFLVDDQLDRQGAPHRILRGCGDGLVKGIGMQAVAVVIDRDQGLQGGADVIERHFPGVQGAP